SYCTTVRAVLLALSAAALCPAQDIDALVERARKEFDVPGIAVAVVKDGKVVLEKGYGVRRIGQPAPVTPNSLFRIASNTKAFTSAALGILVDEGKIHWDDRVVNLMPGFQMFDSYITHEMTVTDLLVHRSGLGLGEGDLMFFPPTDLTREQILQRLRFLKPAASFRGAYAYDNLLYLVAGQLIPAVTGTTWDDFVRQRIFAPVGMTHSATSTDALLRGTDVAIPHAKVNGKLEPLEHENVDNNAPAGSIVSCVSDLAKWVTVQLNHGKLPGGGRLFSEAQSKMMWTGQTILPIHDTVAGLRPNFYEYGLGWFLRDYRGKRVVFHTGVLAGYVSRVLMVPDLNLGVIILTNQEEEGAHSAIAWSIVDHYLGAPATDWTKAFADLSKKEAAEAAAEVAKAGGKRNTASRPSLPLASYAGRYHDAWYGDIVIGEHAGKLTIAFTHSKQLTGDLEHWQYDTFVARWKDRALGADAFVTFSLQPDGSIAEARMKPVSPATDFSFDFQDLLLKPVR
ncbi:MAG TPA: serine hydrolase, partial [Candidatus Sulfopaludibacter sp.]|nr:serine hydrolase [Candidatus Sulfopaludibacter sp.]